MAEKKHLAFALLKILQEESDEEHIIAPARLIERIYQETGVLIERRTLYSNIEVLRQAGYEISDFNENRKGYYLVRREFEKGEILLLCNAIHASHFISQKQSDELIDKLLSTLSVHQQAEFRGNVYLPNRLKSDTRSLFFNIEIISEAIRDGKCIRFTYMHYNRDKKLVPRRKEPYIVEPRYIVYHESRPYMISTHPKYADFTHYRIDKMQNPVILNEQVRHLTKVEQTEAYQYAENKLFMFAGEIVPVTFRCEERIMDQMIDIFGTGLRVLPAEEGYFLAAVRTTQQGAIFLEQQFSDAIEMIQ